RRDLPSGAAGRQSDEDRARRGVLVRQDHLHPRRRHRPEPAGAGARARDRRARPARPRRGPARPCAPAEAPQGGPALMACFEQPQRILLPVNVGYMALTVMLALLFNLMPWHDLVGVPDMVALVIAFWCVHQPRKMGIGAAWFIGLLMDAGNGALLGQHA